VTGSEPVSPGWLAAISLVLLAAFGHAAEQPVTDEAGEGTLVEELVVIGQALDSSFHDLAAYAVADREEIAGTSAAHPHMLFNRLPGTWISRGSGQEHLTAIRSPVLTGAGACGAFLLLENGIPVRPVGFCNVNGLFELDIEQAEAVEVFKGPAGGFYGGNALHGVINVRMPLPTGENSATAALKVGSWGLLTGRMQYQRNLSDHHIRANTLVTRTAADSWRDGANYRQQKISLSHAFSRDRWRVINTLAISNLAQETAGFIRGYRSYRDVSLRRRNFNPDAYRDAWSWRLASSWSVDLHPGFHLDMTSYARRSEMDFLQHFLPGTPMERNGQLSFGQLFDLTWTGRDFTVQGGGQVEWWRGNLLQRQDGPTEGSAFLQATRPVGRHYDYQVDGLTLALFYDLDWQVVRWRFFHTLRLSYLDYDYDNRLASGNLREDGSACGFGGCLYSRPADGKEVFFNLAGRIGWRYRILPSLNLHGLIGAGFRPPQANELYRLQNGQTITDLKSETLVNYEVGLTGTGDGWRYSLAFFAQRKQDVLLRDSMGFNVVGGQTSGTGVEIDVRGRWGDKHSFGAVVSWSRHEYDFTLQAVRGERIQRGNEIDTAPQWLGNMYWRIVPMPSLWLELELSYQGAYYLDAANTSRYEGHRIVNVRSGWRLASAWHVTAGILNVMDTKYADRADFAFGDYRYFPGHPRKWFVEVGRSF